MEILSIGPGPTVGAVQRSLEEQLIDGTIAFGDADAAREWLRRHANLFVKPVQKT
jgi:hypothetical protein